MAVLRMAQRELAMDFVPVPPPIARLCEIASLLEIADDAGRPPLGYSDRRGDVPNARRRICGDACEDVCVVRHEAPRMEVIAGIDVHESVLLYSPSVVAASLTNKEFFKQMYPDEGVDTGSAPHFEVVVIGGGQAGLAMGYDLRQQGRRFVIFERNDSIAPAWRERWDSLTLFTPRRYSALPGQPFPGDPDRYPTRDEVISYLERYAETLELPIELNSEVRKLSREADRFVLEIDGRTIAADQVVVATGPFQTPFVPKLAEQLDPEVWQFHSTGYSQPSDVPEGTVLVVGGGNTGFQIAKELSATHKAVLSVGSKQKPLPQRIAGRDLFWWLTKTHILFTTVESRLGSKLQHRDTLIGSSPRELKRRYGVELKPRATAASAGTVTFEDGSELEVDAVIWATGYRPDYSWIDLPIFDESGRLRHRRGVTDVPGLSFLGLTWQWTRGSALIGWVKDDAKFLAERIAALQEAKTQAPERAPEPVGAAAGVRKEG
jgi:putative flavoprotein involved in K+ transport